jgi:hypothetical protein
VSLFDFLASSNHTVRQPARFLVLPPTTFTGFNVSLEFRRFLRRQISRYKGDYSITILCAIQDVFSPLIEDADVEKVVDQAKLLHKRLKIDLLKLYSFVSQLHRTLPTSMNADP